MTSTVPIAFRLVPTRLVAAAKAGAQVPEQVARLVRVVEYTVPDRNPDGEVIAIITTILDPHKVSALELAAAYQQRWEEESAPRASSSRSVPFEISLARACVRRLPTGGAEPRVVELGAK